MYKYRAQYTTTAIIPDPKLIIMDLDPFRKSRILDPGPDPSFELKINQLSSVADPKLFTYQPG